jgi:lipopolysaccharide/colanic/teichoic acid biosynthesis glycosyltransferase
LKSHKVMTAPNQLLVARDGTTTESLDLQASSYRPAWARTLKRTIDILCACLGLMALAPLMAMVAFLIKLQDGGPVFHRRKVVGPRGSFDAFKFRTMRPDADAILRANPTLQEQFQRNFKLKNDQRVTPLGAFLRKYSVDELPQLWNVLLGQMSLVGPRMITAEELEKYGDCQHVLLSVQPGLTGYWQVSGRQGIDYSQRVQMDMCYIKNWSLTFDMRILLQTPVAVLKAKGAL